MQSSECLYSVQGRGLPEDNVKESSDHLIIYYWEYNEREKDSITTRLETEKIWFDPMILFQKWIEYKNSIYIYIYIYNMAKFLYCVIR